MRTIAIALGVVVVLFAVWWWLGTPDSEAAASEAVAPAGAAPTSAVGGAAETLSAAAATSCPDYVVVVDPNTGGSAVVDACADGDPSSIDSQQSEGATASSASYGRCKTVYRHLVVKNRLGWSMYWVTLGKYWCWRNGSITYKPTTSFDHGVTSFGATMQWDDISTTDKNTWNSPDNWESYSWATEQFKRCVPSPLGCIKIGSDNVTARTHAYGDGSYRFGG